MGAGELGDAASAREPSRRSKALHGIDGLGDQRVGLCAARLVSDSGLADQLGQAARRAQPHLQWISRIWAGVLVFGEVVTRGLVAQGEYEMARLGRA